MKENALMKVRPGWPIQRCDHGMALARCRYEPVADDKVAAVA